MSVRRERIAEQLRAEIAQVLRRHATDPRLQMVTLTRVDVAPDLSHAIVFWSTVSLDRQIDHAERPHPSLRGDCSGPACSAGCRRST